MDMHLLTSLLLFTPIIVFSLIALPWTSWFLCVLGYEAISGWAVIATGMLCTALGIGGIGYASYHTVHAKQRVPVKQVIRSSELQLTKK